MDNAAERQAALAGWLRDQEFLTVSDACERSSTSPATIRRDFAQLVAQGLAERHRGGVRRARRDALAMVPFAVREMRFSIEKSAIAKAAAALIAPGDVIFVDGGTSTLHLAEHLGQAAVRVITNSLRLAAALADRATDPTSGTQAMDVHVTGGHLLPRSGMLVGPQAREGIARFHARWAFLSVGGIGLDGAWNTDEAVTEIEQLMLTNAEQVVVLADHTKLGTKALLHMAPLNRIHRIITDAAADHTQVRALRDAGCTVQLVAAG